MPPRPSLRLRFTLASMALVLSMSALGACVVYAVQEYIEDNLLLQLMEREVEEYARLYREDQTQRPPRSSELRSYVVGPGEADTLPEELRDVPPGIWHDVLIGGRNYQVANFTLQDKRFYLTYDITAVEERERWLTIALASTVLLATALAAALGWRLSSVVLAPVARLASEIERLDPEQPAARLAPRFPEADLGVIASAFDYYLGRLAAFIERERAFTEDASHELRTPIAVVATAAERLAGDAALPAPLRATVDRISRAGRQMQSTTQALLFMAREAEPSAEAMRLLPLRGVVEEVIAEQRATTGGAVAITATLDGAGGVRVPHGLAAIVVGNLLQNAIKHSGASGVEVVQEGDGVVVRDHGAGIPAEELPRVLERHYRGRRSGGLGLGLHIVKRICDRQGWTLDVTSAPDAGTAVSVRFAEPLTQP